MRCIVVGSSSIPVTNLPLFGTKPLYPSQPPVTETGSRLEGLTYVIARHVAQGCYC